MFDIHHVLHLFFNAYGYWILFFSLLLEMLGLPLPGETIMTYTGLIVYDGSLSWPLSVAIGGAGATVGMTLAYWIGYRFGNPFFEKYGSRLHFGPEKLNGASRWFGRYGNKLLLIAYFIPGIRHLTGYFAGTTRLPFRQFAAYAYTGAALWVILFITLGTGLGPKWEQYHDIISLYMLAFGLSSAAAILFLSLFKKIRPFLRYRATEALHKVVRHHRTNGQAQIVLLTAIFYLAAFVSLANDLVCDCRDWLIKNKPVVRTWIGSIGDLGRR
jgi:membrane protein DedA with SNARE-associated domain